MKKLLFLLLSFPFACVAQDSVVDIIPGEYFTGILTNNGQVLSDVWGGFVGVNRDTIISHGLNNIAQLGGGWHAGFVRDKTGAIFSVYKDNGNGGKASYSTIPTDAYGNSFIGNTDVYAWMDAGLTLKNDSVYMWGPDHLGINGGANIAKPMKLPQPPGKRVVKLQPIEPGTSPTNDCLMAYTSDGQIWIYPKGAKGTPYLKMQMNSPAVIGAIGQGVFVVATNTDIVAWGGVATIVGIPNTQTQTPTSILATFEKAGLKLPVLEISGDWNNLMILDCQHHLFSIGDAIHGSTAVNNDYPDWRHHSYTAANGTKTAAPWAWNFQVAERPQPYAMWVPGQFLHVRNCICQSFHYYAQDLLGHWYACGRNKAGALSNGEEVQNSDVFPEWRNQAFFIKVNPLNVRWPDGGGPRFDSTKTQPITITAGVDQLINTDTTTLYGMANQQAGTITGWYWTKKSGSGTIDSPKLQNTTVRGLSSGTSVFTLTVWSSFGGTVSSDVLIVSTKPALPPAPVAKITIDSTTIHSPTSFVRVSGDSSTGSGISYQWSQLCGPSAAIVTPVPGSKSGNLFSGLLPDTYSFQLQVKDSLGRTSLAVVNVTVLPVPACPVCPPLRTVVGLQVTLNGQLFTIPTSWAKFALSDGTNQ